MRFETTQGKFAKMSEKQRTLLVMQAEKVDELKNAYEDAKFAVEFDKQSEAINRNTAQLGMNAVQRDLSAAAQELENQGIKKGTELYDQLLAKRRAALEGAQSAKRNPVLGIQEGLVSIGENVNDVAGQMKSALVGAFDGASDALTQFVMTGKLKFGDLARSILADLAKMIIKQMLFNLLSAGMNAMGLGSLLGPTKAAKGMAVDGGVRKFASGGVVTSPTMFKFASGGQFRNGLMGEAGPEAIMPLARTSSGKLGVVSTGGGGSTSVVVNVNVESGSEQVSSNQGAGALGKIIAGAVRTELINQKRPGGLLAA
jgi:lambda family phage tail tape measure protein